VRHPPDITLPGRNETRRYSHPEAETAAPEKTDAPAGPARPDLPVVPARLDLPTTLVNPGPPPPPPQSDPPAGASRPDPPPAAARAEAEGEEPPRGRGLAAAQVRRLAVLAVTIVLLGTGAGLLGALVWPATYAARAEILYPIGQDEVTGPLRADRNLATQLVLLRGRAVLGPVAQAQDRTVEDLEEDVTVKILETSEVIQVEGRGPSPAAAIGTLQAIVERYFALESSTGPDGVREYLDGELAVVQSDIADARGRLVQLQAESAAGIGDPAGVTSADAELQMLLSRQQDIQAQLDDLNIESASGRQAQLLTPAYAVPEPVSPRPLVAAGTGVLVGLIVSAVAVALAARRWIRN
jgi:uncharacterized protein involved in exopolysaccharide biosynthesis